MFHLNDPMIWFGLTVLVWTFIDAILKPRNAKTEGSKRDDNGRRDDEGWS